MYTYRNTRTGAIVVVPCPVGGHWELVEEPKADEPKEPAPKKATAKKKTKK